MSLLRALHAELLKLKRTLAFSVIFVLPLLVALLQFFIVLSTKKFPAGFDLWHTIGTSSLQILGRVLDATADHSRDSAA